MIVRLWTSTSPTTGLPFSTSVPSWHQLCDCGQSSVSTRKSALLKAVAAA